MVIKTQPHYVRSNETCRIPRRWVYFDTEAVIVGDQWRQEQTWRLGVTTFEHRDNHKREWVAPETRRWDDPADLWAYIGECTKAGSRTIVVAHNIGYDLRISNALVHLPSQGWELKLMSIGGRNLTMTLKRDKATMVLVDFMSWLPTGLEAIGQLVGTPKLKLPDQDDTTEAWYLRCERDVDILRQANREVIEWVERDDLGNWQRTGASMAWSNWRHRHYSHRVLVHADELARDYEVIASGAARCEVYRHGKLRGGPWVEWDLPNAYPSVCLAEELPTALIGHVWRPEWANYEAARPGQRAILTATVTTEAPVLPVKSAEGWLWPVGTFTGSWWDSELHLAASRGAEVDLHHAVLYKAAPALKQWAWWVLNLVNNPDVAATPLQRALAKHFSRAFIGRFGAKFPLWEPFGAASTPGIDLAGFYDFDSGQMGKMLTVGGESFIGLEKEWVADANPAIMGAVLSACRQRLWQIFEAAGFENIVYCDTDSVIVNGDGHNNLSRWTSHGEGWGLRVKGQYNRLELLGPRQMIVEGRGRISGLPKRASRSSANEWVGERWDGVQTSLGSGQPDVVVVRDVVWRVNGIDRRRLHLAGGATAPVRVKPC